jgi:hypothetical protein
MYLSPLPRLLNHISGDSDHDHRPWVISGQGSEPPETWNAGRDYEYIHRRNNESVWLSAPVLTLAVEAKKSQLKQFDAIPNKAAVSE